jgi:signal transduction histidine kinase
MRRMAHDMRGTLMTLTATSDMLVQGTYGELTPSQARASQRMQRNSYRMVTLIDDLMTYVKADAKQLPLTAESFEPRVLFDHLREKVSLAADSKGLALHWPDDLPETLVGDSNLITRLLLAVLWNAIGYTTTGDVWIESRWTPDTLWSITIRDSGPGIAPDEVARIFHPFFHGEQRATVPTSGSGLGLPMALALARLMGGQLTLEKTGSDGSTFCIQLPLKPV